MKPDQYSNENDELKDLLKQYNNFKNGRKFNFLEEESFIMLIDYFDEADQLPHEGRSFDHAATIQ